MPGESQGIDLHTLYLRHMGFGTQVLLVDSLSDDDLVESMANMLKVPFSRIDSSNRPHHVKMAVKDKL